MKTSENSLPAHINDLYERATEARLNAHAPYSKCLVGSAIRTSQGDIFNGCNVENASYGATVCAERVAIQKAISEKGGIQIVELVVVTHASPPWPPCGMCRQVISEFASNTLVVYATNLEGEWVKSKWTDLFPQAFLSSHVGK